MREDDVTAWKALERLLGASGRHAELVEVLGRRGELSEDLAEVRKWAAVLGGRYMGADRADEYGARNGVPGELLVRLRAEHVVAMRDISD